MIMMVVTAKVAVEPQAVAVKTVMIVNMILLHMAPSAVIQPGMSMVLIVPHWKAAMAGIAQVVHVLVTVVELMVALMVALMVVTAMLAMFRIVLMLIAVQRVGLVMVLLTVKIRLMAVI